MTGDPRPDTRAERRAESRSSPRYHYVLRQFIDGGAQDPLHVVELDQQDLSLFFSAGQISRLGDDNGLIMSDPGSGRSVRYVDLLAWYLRHGPGGNAQTGPGQPAPAKDLAEDPTDRQIRSIIDWAGRYRPPGAPDASGKPPTLFAPETISPTLKGSAQCP